MEIWILKLQLSISSPYFFEEKISLIVEITYPHFEFGTVPLRIFLIEETWKFGF